MRAAVFSMLAAVLTAAAASVATGCAVDRRPLTRTPAYVGAIDAVSKAAEDAPRGAGELSAGWSRVEIKAPAGVPLAGYGDREGAASTGVLDPVYVRAFAIESGPARAVIFTADLLLTSPEVVGAVAGKLKDKVPREALFFTASHSHSAPGGYVPGMLWELVFGSFDSAALDAVVEAHVRAAELALANLQPATIGYAEAHAPGLVQNRVEKGGLTDDRVLIVRFERIADQASAILWSFACHAVTLPSSNLRLSADYPGVIAAQLEGRKHQVVGYAAGGVGSSNPRYERPDDSRWLTEPLQRALESGIEEARGKARASVAIATAQTLVDLPAPRYRVGRENAILAPFVKAILKTPRATFGAISIDNLVLAHVPVELSGELTRTARARARTQGITLGIFPFNGTYAGYVVPRRVYDLSDEQGEEMLAYETQTLAFFGPWSGDFMMNVALRLAAGVHRAAESVRVSPSWEDSGAASASR